MEARSGNGYRKLNGRNGEPLTNRESQPTQTIENKLKDHYRQEEENLDAVADWGNSTKRGYSQIRREAEEEERVSELDSSEEVDEHRLLSVSCAGTPASRDQQTASCTATALNLSQDHWNDADIDPFSYCPPLTKMDYLKVSVNALWLLPLRLIFVIFPSVLMGIIACSLAIVCDRYDEDNPQPLNKWGRFVMNYLGWLASRILLFGFGFNWIKTRGVPAPTKEAPILVVSPHSSLLDMFIISLYKVPTYLAKADIRDTPIFGRLITKTLRTIYVEREDPQSRMKAAEEIHRRTHTRGVWPKVLIFPEGTTTNRTALINFKRGAFLPKLPVQPVLIKFKNRLNIAWTEEDHALLKSLLLTVCQMHNSLEVEFLPIYHPSEEERSNAKLYARNVQILMARTLGVPYTDHTFEDIILMRIAKHSGLPPSSGLVVYQHAATELNMDVKTMKKWLRRFAAIDRDKNGFITVEDFAKFLHLPNDACLQAVFVAANVNGDRKLGFKNYLHGIIGKAKPLLQDRNFMQTMFRFFDHDGDGTVSLEDVSRQFPIGSLPLVEHHEREQRRPTDHERPGCDVSYQNSGGEIPEEMNQEQFSSLLAFHPEYVLVFYECQHTGVSSPPAAAPPRPVATMTTHGKSCNTITDPASISSGRGSARNGLMTHPIVAQKFS